MEYNGKKIKFKLDLGAVKSVQKMTGKNFFSLKEGDFDADVYSALIYACAERAGNKIPMEFIDGLSFKELFEVQKEIDGLMEDFLPEGEAVKNPTPQS